MGASKKDSRSQNPGGGKNAVETPAVSPRWFQGAVPLTLQPAALSKGAQSGLLFTSVTVICLLTEEG